MSGAHHSSIFAEFLDDDGNVVIGGKPATDWLDGSSRPHFLYSKEILKERILELRSNMPPDLRLNYAVKSNPFQPFLRAVDPLVDGFDIASIGELRRLIAAGCNTDNVSFAGPGKSRDEIREAASHAVKIIVESPHQLALCESVGQELGIPVRAMVRINDQKARPGGGLSMAGAKTVFGWDLEDFQTNGAKTFASLAHVEFSGLHLFYGSQILQSTAIAENIRISVDTITTLNLPSEPKLINLGGGLGVPYGPKDVPLELTDLTAPWSEAMERLTARFPTTNVCVELGRYVSAPTGVFLVQVLDRKSNGGTDFVVCSGGLQNFSAATGNFGQVLKRNHPLRAVRSAHNLSPVTVTGPLCTPMDVFARDIMLADVSIGDYIAVFQAGAYGATASPSAFLSHPAAVEMVIDDAPQRAQPTRKLP